MREDKKASTPSGKVPRKYIFFDQMLFLRKVYQEKEAVSNNDLQSNPNDPATEKEAFSSSPTSNSNHSLSFITQPPVVLKGLQSQRCERKRKSDYFENKLLEILEKSREPPVMPDHHMSFFASLIPLLYQMSDEEILEFRMDVLTSIKRIRAQSTLP